MAALYVLLRQTLKVQHTFRPVNPECKLSTHVHNPHSHTETPGGQNRNGGGVPSSLRSSTLLSAFVHGICGRTSNEHPHEGSHKNCSGSSSSLMCVNKTPRGHLERKGNAMITTAEQASQSLSGCVAMVNTQVLFRIYRHATCSRWQRSSLRPSQCESVSTKHVRLENSHKVKASSGLTCCNMAIT